MSLSDYLEKEEHNLNNLLTELISKELLIKVLKKEFIKRNLKPDIFYFSLIDDHITIFQSTGFEFSLNIYYLASLYKLLAADNQYLVSSQPGALSIIKYIDGSYVSDYAGTFEVESIIGAVERLNIENDLSVEE